MSLDHQPSTPSTEPKRLVSKEKKGRILVFLKKENMARPKRGGAKNTPKKLEEEIDYAAVADALANGHSGSEDDESEPDDQADKVEYDEQSEEEGESSEESQDSGPENDDDSASNDDHGGNENDEPRPHIELTPPTSATGEQCTFDLRNLLAINSHQVNSSLLYKKRKAKDTGDELHLTIPPSSDRMEVVVNEDYLLEKATDGCTQLIAALWQLPMTKSDAGPMATLPPFDESRIPRALVSHEFVLADFVIFPCIRLTIPSSFPLIASTTTKEGNCLGKICQGKRYSTQ